MIQALLNVANFQTLGLDGSGWWAMDQEQKGDPFHKSTHLLEKKPCAFLSPVLESNANNWAWKIAFLNFWNGNPPWSNLVSIMVSHSVVMQTKNRLTCTSKETQLFVFLPRKLPFGFCNLWLWKFWTKRKGLSCKLLIALVCLHSLQVMLYFLVSRELCSCLQQMFFLSFVAVKERAKKDLAYLGTVMPCQLCRDQRPVSTAGLTAGWSLTAASVQVAGWDEQVVAARNANSSSAHTRTHTRTHTHTCTISCDHSKCVDYDGALCDGHWVWSHLDLPECSCQSLLLVALATHT